MRTTTIRRGATAGAVGYVGMRSWPLVWSSRPVRCALRPELAGIGHPGRVALTFDDGPDPASTPRFLRALDRLGWTATFFLLGEMVVRSPALAAEVAAAGHEVAVHGYRHRNHVFRSAHDVRDDMLRAQEVIQAATHTTPRWFRPPYGALSTATLAAASECGLTPVLWSAWGRDWRSAATPESVHRDVCRTLEGGGTILLHDSDCTSAHGAWHSALDALGLLAETLEERSLTVGPLGRHGIERSAELLPFGRPGPVVVSSG